MIDGMIHRGDIFLVDLSDRTGSEQRGVRPAVVVQNEIGNRHSPTTIICPITSRHKSNEITHVVLTPDDGGIIKDSVVLCEQLLTIDKSRIRRKVGEITNIQKIMDINAKMLVSLGIGTERS